MLQFIPINANKILEVGCAEGLTEALTRRSGVQNVNLDLNEATFTVEGVELDAEDLKQTIKSWGGYDYRVGETNVVA